MAIEEEDSGGGIPEWVVTFGDMMSLLLTFFIMLVSLSEIKQEEKYQAMVESLRRQFGHDASVSSVVPGHVKPRNSAIAKLATMGRARRLDVVQGGSPTKAPQGENPQQKLPRPGQPTGTGVVIYFELGSATLSDANQHDLRGAVKAMVGKPQKIEIRGHTSLKPVGGDSPDADNWDLAYRRCRATMAYLVDDLNIEENRIRLSVAGKNEPVFLTETVGQESSQKLRNPRVEVFLLNEIVRDLLGTRKEQLNRVTEGQD